MDFAQFIGGSYESQSTMADCEETWNWYPELLQAPGATRKAVLYPTPGVDALSAAPTGVGRAHLGMNGREFAVIGAKFYEVDSGGALLERGDVAIDDHPGTISSNGDIGNQLFITSGSNGYCFDLGSNTLTQIPSMDGKCTMGDFLDGYFLVMDSRTSTLYISALADGSSWSPGLDFAQRSLAPDRWRSMKVSSRFIWLFGEQTTEVWYDTGANFPFAPHPSGLLQYGIAAPFSAGVIGTDVVWLATSKSGKVCVVKAEGFTPKVISTYPFETNILKYQNIVDTVADVYSERGHTFYMLNFDVDDVTWAWDAETEFWHKRGSWHPNERAFSSWRPRFFARAFNQHRTLDAGGSIVYRMGADLTGDVEGQEIRRLRRCPAIVDENKRVFYSSFEVDLEAGLGSGEDGVTTAEFVTWGGLIMATDQGGGTLAKDAPEDDNTWDSGGVSTQLLYGNGYVEFTNSEIDSRRAFGLSTSASPILSTDDLTFGFFIEGFDTGAADNAVLIYVSGAAVSVEGNFIVDTIEIGDVLRVAVDSGGIVTFWINGVLIYTALVLAGFPLYAAGLIETWDGEIAQAFISRSTPDPPDYDPVVMLRCSNDGGKTWIFEQMRSAGKMGEYTKRIRWNRLGSGRRRVFEVSVSAPIPWRMVGAYLEASAQFPRTASPAGVG